MGEQGSEEATEGKNKEIMRSPLQAFPIALGEGGRIIFTSHVLDVPITSFSIHRRS